MTPTCLGLIGTESDSWVPQSPQPGLWGILTHLWMFWIGLISESQMFWLVGVLPQSGAGSHFESDKWVFWTYLRIDLWRTGTGRGTPQTVDTTLAEHCCLAYQCMLEHKVFLSSELRGPNQGNSQSPWRLERKHYFILPISQDSRCFRKITTRPEVSYVDGGFPWGFEKFRPFRADHRKHTKGHKVT